MSRRRLPNFRRRTRSNRFQMVFRRFLGVFARPEHPLALFLDDLQWLDAATLDLLEHWSPHPDVRHLLLVGAYRDNEVGSSHPLMRTLATIRDAGEKVHEIVLAPLAARRCRARSSPMPCARTGSARGRWPSWCSRRPSGNPFFAIQFFTALAEEGLLAFDAGDCGWHWDLDRIRAKGFTDNVVDLMAAKLSRLPGPTPEALEKLACLGNVRRDRDAALVHGVCEEAIDAALWEPCARASSLAWREHYAFLHDRVQEAAYALIPEARAARQCICGSAECSRTDGAGRTRGEYLRHRQPVRPGCALVDSPGEREQVAGLNLIAGKRAKAATAYASACSISRPAARCWRTSGWEQQLPSHVRAGAQPRGVRVSDR